MAYLSDRALAAIHAKKAHGVSYQSMAIKCGISAGTFSMWIRRQRPIPKPGLEDGRVRQLAVYLELPVREMLDR